MPGHDIDPILCNDYGEMIDSLRMSCDMEDPVVRNLWRAHNVLWSRCFLGGIQARSNMIETLNVIDISEASIHD